MNILRKINVELRPMVYIASPYTNGDNFENVRRQIDTAELLVENGFVPQWPLSSAFWNFVYPHPHEYWMELDYQYILRCDAVLRLDGNSKGADSETVFATTHNIPVFNSIDELKLWFA